MRQRPAFCLHIPRFFLSKRDGTWKAWASRFSPTLVSRMSIRMELWWGSRKFRLAPCSGEPVSLRLALGNGWVRKRTSSEKVMVEPDLSVRDHREVFVIGDTLL